MINNRQNGRRRGRGGQRPQGGNPGRPDGGNRIDNRARGNANQLYEKYKTLARDAQMQGDRVTTEYYLQFADHYFRVLSESRSRFEEQNQNQQRRQPESFDDGFDDGEEFGDEGEPVRADQYQRVEQPQERRDGEREGGRDREAGREGARDREGGRDREASRDREGGRRERRPRYGNGDVNGNAFDENGGATEDGDQPTLTPRDPVTAMASTERGADEEVAPRRRGRPPRAVSEAQEPATHEADRLPPALSLSANPDADNDDGAEPRPRRRRGRPPGSAEAQAS